MKLTKLSEKQKTFLKKSIPIAAFIGGLCCFTPVVLVLLGLSTISFAASLSDILYHGYAWYFRGAALLFLLIALIYYFYKYERICTLDKAKRKKQQIINTILVAIIIAVLAYIVWLYVIVEIIGLLLGIWSIP